MADRQLVEGANDARRQLVLDCTIGRNGQSDHVGRQEGGDDRHRHDHGIEEIADNTQRQAQRGDDKRELTNLSHGEATAHGRLQGLASQHEAERAEHGLTNKDGQHQGKDGECIADQYLRVDQHTDGHEEDGAKQILHRLHQLLNLFGLDGLGQNAAHDKGSEG